MKVGLVTHGRQSIQKATIEALGIWGLLDQILISESEGVRKPDPEIFFRAASRLELRTTECCFVGDHPEADGRWLRQRLESVVASRALPGGVA